MLQFPAERRSPLGAEDRYGTLQGVPERREGCALLQPNSLFHFGHPWRQVGEEGSGHTPEEFFVAANRGKKRVGFLSRVRRKRVDRGLRRPSCREISEDRFQHIETKGLSEDRHKTGVEEPLLVSLGVVAGQSNNDEIARLFFLSSEFLQDLCTGHAWHFLIQKNDVENLAPQGAQCFFTAGDREDAMPTILEVLTGEPSKVVLVVSKKNPHKRDYLDSRSSRPFSG